MADINIEADVGGAIAGIRQMQAVMEGLIGAYDTFAESLAKANRLGGETAEAFKKTDAAAENYRATIEAIGEVGVLKNQAQAAEDLARKMKKAADEAEQLAEAQRRSQAASQIQAAARAVGVDITGLGGRDPATIQAARNAINGLNQSMQAGRVTAEDLQIAIQALNTKSLAPLAGGAAIAATQLGQLKNVTEGTVAPVRRFSISVEGMVRLLEVFVIRRVLFALAGQLRELTEEALKFTQVAAQMEAAVTPLGTSAARIRNQVALLGQEFGQNIQDVGKAEVKILNTNLTDAQGSARLLQEALKLSSTGVGDLNSSTEALIQTLKAFGLSAANANSVAAQLFDLARRSDTDVKTIATSFGNLGNTARNFGVSLPQITEALKALTDRGLSFHQAVSLIEQIFQRLEGRQLKKIFDEYQVSTGEALVQTLGFAKAFDVIIEKAREGEIGLEGVRSIAGRVGSAFQGLTQDGDNAVASITAFERASKLAADALNTRFLAALEKTKGGLKVLTEGFVIVLTNILEGINAIGEAAVGGASTSQLVARMRDTIQKSINEQNKLVDATKNAAKLQDQAYFEYLNHLQHGFEQVFDLQKQKLVEAAEATRTSLSGFTGELRREISQGEANIKRFREEIDRIHEDSERRIFKINLDAATPIQKVQLVINRINQLMAEASSRLGQAVSLGGDPSETNRAIARYQEIRTILNETGNSFINLHKIGDQASLQELARSIQASRESQKRGQEELNILNKLAAGRGNQAQLEQQLNNVRNQRRASDDAAEKSNARIAQLLSRQIATGLSYNQFLLLQLSTEENITRELQKRAIEQEETNRQRQKELEDLNGAIKVYEQALANITKLKPGDTGLPEAATKLIEARNKLDESIRKFAKTPEEALRGLETRARLREEVAQVLKLQEINAGILLVNEIQTKSRDQQQDLQQAVENSKRQLDVFANERISTITNLIKTLSSRFQDRGAGLGNVKDIQEGLKAAGADPAKVVPDEIKNRLQQVIDKTKEWNNSWFAFLTGFKTNKDLISDLEAWLQKLKFIDDETKQINDNIKRVGTGSTFQNIITPEVLQAMENYKKGIADIATTLQQIQGLKLPAVGGFKDVTPEGFAEGGYVHGPGGRDALIGRLTRGEFISTPEATRQFYTLLTAMNSGRLPGFAEGGLVGNTTNVGDITINMTARNTNEQTVRDLGQRLVREIRRGTLRF